MRPLLPCLLFLISLLESPGRAAIAPASKEEELAVAAAVHKIFESKCLDCHGAQLPRPKGKFGYVLDLKKVSEKRKYVVKGDPEKSDIYTLVRDDEMPGEDADVPPLTKAEKDVVKRWIAIGAPAELPAKSAAPAEQSVEEKPELKMAFGKRALRWIGRFHAVSTHFPVALMFVAVFAEALAWFTRRESWIQTVRFLVWVAALGAVSAAVLGWINAWFSSYVGESAAVLLWHRWLGTATALWAVLCAGLVLIDECKEGSKERQRFRGALLLGAVLVGITGFLGSALIYGLDHYRW